jgi:hypothetical protein
MNTRKLGKTLIGIGIIILIAYIAWIVFRVVAKPELVAERGLLPNPFTESLPFIQNNNEEELIDEGILEETKAPEEIPVEPEKRLFPLVLDQVVNYRVFSDEEMITSISAETGRDIQTTVLIPRIRYARTLDGNILDLTIKNGKVKADIISNQFIDGLSFVDFGVNGYAGMYQGTLMKKPVHFVHTFISETEEVPDDRPLCPYDFSKQFTLGQVNESIEYMQLLITRRTGYREFNPGIFDVLFVKGLKLYQKSKNTAESGAIDVKTKQHLVDDCRSNEQEKGSDNTLIENKTLKKIKTQILQSVTPQSALDVFPGRDSLVYFKNSGAGIIGLERDMLSGAEKTVYSLSFSEWDIDTTERGVYMTTRPSGTVPGSVFLASGQQSLTPLITGYNGLSVTPSPSGEKLLYSFMDGTTPVVSIVSAASPTEPVAIDVQTFAEKCTWSRDEKTVYCAAPTVLSGDTYPDEWYKRGTEFVDTMYRIDVDSGQATEMEGVGEITEQSFDIERLRVTDDGKYLIMQDWNTRYLWGYKL